MSLFPISKSTSKLALLDQLQGSRLVIPSIAIGNVPQLSTDLLIHNLGTSLIARLDSTLLYPFASPVDYVTDSESTLPFSSSTSVSTGLELYFNPETKLAIIQQRSPILPGYAKNFVQYIVSLVQECNFSSVVVLDSNDSALREDINIDRPLEFYSNTLTDHFKSLKVTNTSTSNDDDKLKKSFTPFVHTLVDELKSVRDLSVYALVMFVYEGDNFFDAQVISEEVTGILEVASPKTWKRPVSWGGAYGDRPIPLGLDEGIYG